MSKRTVLCVLGVLLLTVGLAGCEKKAPSALSEKGFVGTWIEDLSKIQASGASGASIRKGAATEQRELVINDDGTYKMTLMTPDGKPVEPAQSCSGTWKISTKDMSVLFETTTRTLDDKHANDAPMGTLQMGLKAKGAAQDFIDVKTEGGMRLKFLRPEKK